MYYPQVIYRSACENDACQMISTHYAAVQAIERSYYSEEVLRAWSPTPDDDRCRWLADQIACEFMLCEVAATSSGGVVGFCMGNSKLSQLKALYVRPEYSGQGIGASLLGIIEEKYRAVDISSIELHASYNAVSFYRYNGYQAIRQVTQPLANGSEMGAILMVKRFCAEA